MLDKANKLAGGFADKFEKNVTAFVSFFITSILAKVLTDSSFSGVFNRPVAIIGLVIVAGSTLHLLLSIYLFNTDKQHLLAESNKLKERYSDILDKAELDKIFDKHGKTEQVSDYLDSKCKLFVRVWIALLIVALVLILAMVDWKSDTKAGPSKISIAAPGRNQTDNASIQINR